MNKKILAAACAVFVLPLAACSDDDETDDGGTEVDTEVTTDATTPTTTAAP